jgi:hypothetical protein
MKRWAILIAAAVCSGVASAAPVKIQHDSKALQFSYSWPAEAAAAPALDKRFRAETAKAYKDALSIALENQKIYREQKRDAMQDFYSMEWSTAGQSMRLLSLQNELSTFTGGAHPNTGYNALLWDRRARREIAWSSLFRQPGSFAALTRTAYCRGLDKERAKRRQGEKLDLPDFNACPKFSDLAIAPVDSNNDGRFDAIQYVASPYTAGPYAEGAYNVTLPVTSQLIAAIKPEFRTAFARQRQ